MSSIRLARGFTGRSKIMFAGCYHGHVDSLLVKVSGSLTLGNPDKRVFRKVSPRKPSSFPITILTQWRTPLLNRVKISPPSSWNPTRPTAVSFCPRKDTWKACRLARTTDPVLIFDEVMTGFRLGIGGVQERTGVTPDLTAMGKIIGGGLPVGAFGGKSEIMDWLAPLGPVYQAGTLSGNPLAMAAGITSLQDAQ